MRSQVAFGVEVGLLGAGERAGFAVGVDAWGDLVGLPLVAVCVTDGVRSGARVAVEAVRLAIGVCAGEFGGDGVAEDVQAAVPIRRSKRVPNARNGSRARGSTIISPSVCLM